MRYLSSFILKDLKQKMVFLAGPRQCGKSTLAKNLLDARGVYLNWDIRSDQRIIREASWAKNSSLIVLDELHKYTGWKNYLKGLCDEFKNKPPLLVTGSARLETFRRQGDALTGRYFLYRLHPIDVAEAVTFFPKQSPKKLLERLLKTGGFPEAFLHPVQSERLRNLRFDVVLQEDLRDLSKTNSLKGLSLLIELLRERVCGQLNYANLSQDLRVSAPTVKQWVELLERLYVVFTVLPYSQGLARSLSKNPKVYFYDCAAALSEPSDSGQRLENLVACSLLKFCEFQRDNQGKKMELHYFRDREKREVDFVITLNRKPYWLIEVKTGDDSLSPSLKYLHERLKPKASFQLVGTLSRPKELNGIEIVSAADWLVKLGMV